MQDHCKHKKEKREREISNTMQFDETKEREVCFLKRKEKNKRKMNTV